MFINPDVCPECGAAIRGTCDLVPAVALVERDPATGEFEYSGESKMCWDGQTTETDDVGRWRLICLNGHEFFAEVTEG